MQTQYTVESYNKESNSVTFKPFSPLLKNPIEEYPFYNFDIVNLDSLEDLDRALSEISSSILDKVIKAESQDLEKNQQFIESNFLNKTFTISCSSLTSKHYALFNREISINNSGLNFIN